MISDSKIAEIRQRSDILEIVGGFVTLQRAGANYKAVCPFHADSDPSFNVNPANQFFHCFGCGASGDVFTFIQKIEGIDFYSSIKHLASRYGIDLEETYESPKAKSEREKRQDLKKKRKYILEQAAIFFEKHLATSAGQAAREMLKKRGIEKESIETFRLGYAPDSWDFIIKHFEKNSISPKELEESGLAIKGKKGGYYDRFRDRLVFTVTDPSGNPIAFSARTLDGPDSDAGAKYINSPGTPEFKKGEVLYGLHQARVSLGKTKEAILVEGNFDVVSMSQAGFKNAVAPLGTALTAKHALLLKRRIKNVIVMFDGDASGRKAAAKAFTVLASAGIATYTAPLPDGEDPDSFVNSRGKDAMKKHLESKKGLLDQIIHSAVSGCDSSAQDVSRRIQKLGSLLNYLTTTMEKDLYKQKIAQAFNVDHQVIFKHLRNVNNKTIPKPAEEAPPGSVEERELAGLVMDNPATAKRAVKDEIASMVRNDEIRNFIYKVSQRNSPQRNSISDILTEMASGPLGTWFSKRALECIYREDRQIEQAFYDVKVKLMQHYLNDKINIIDKEITLAGTQGDEEKILHLSREKTKLQRQSKSNAPQLSGESTLSA